MVVLLPAPWDFENVTPCKIELNIPDVLNCCDFSFC